MIGLIIALGVMLLYVGYSNYKFWKKLSTLKKEHWKVCDALKAKEEDNSKLKNSIFSLEFDNNALSVENDRLKKDYLSSQQEIKDLLKELSWYEHRYKTNEIYTYTS